VRIPIEAGKATIEALSLQGADLEANVEGGLVRLAPKLSQSTLAGKLKIKPSDDWWTRNEMLKNMANFALPAGKDGFRTITLAGQLRSPCARK
jgi:type II secretion system protein N